MSLVPRVHGVWPKYDGLNRLAKLIYITVVVVAAMLLSTQLFAVEIDKRGAQQICTHGFDDFFKLFVADSAFRLLHTEKHLMMKKIDVAAEPEPASVITATDNPIIINAWLSNLDYLMIKGVQKPDVKESAATVMIYLPDTDYQVVLHFKRKHYCWMLYLIEDQSL